MDTLLQQLGLTENETKVYLAFLKHGEKVAAEISRILKMDKSSTYRAVETLITKSLLIPNPKIRGTTYSSANLEVLKKLITNKKIELETQSQTLNMLINQLKSSSNNETKTFIKVEKGIEAIKQSFADSLECKEKIIREKWSSNHPDLKEKNYVNFIYKTAELRIQKGILMRELSYTHEQTMYPTIEKTSKLILKEIRIMPDEIDKDISFRIYDHTMYLISLNELNELIIITIKDYFFVKLMKNLYDYIWSNSKPISSLV
jgi:sugar-specific transcriptional regulator TrmB